MLALQARIWRSISWMLLWNVFSRNASSITCHTLALQGLISLISSKSKLTCCTKSFYDLTMVAAKICWLRHSLLEACWARQAASSNNYAHSCCYSITVLVNFGHMQTASECLVMLIFKSQHCINPRSALHVACTCCFRVPLLQLLFMPLYAPRPTLEQACIRNQQLQCLWFCCWCLTWTASGHVLYQWLKQRYFHLHQNTNRHALCFMQVLTMSWWKPIWGKSSCCSAAGPH